MIKKIFYIIYLFFIININNIFAVSPEIIGEVHKNLPWGNINDVNKIPEILGWWLISTMIRYVAIIAVLSLMLSWIMYLISGWEEEKVKKAKNWIIWSLLGVFFSISAWWIIEIINNIQIIG